MSRRHHLELQITDEAPYPFPFPSALFVQSPAALSGPCFAKFHGQ